MPTGALSSQYWPGDGQVNNVPVGTVYNYSYPYHADHGFIDLHLPVPRRRYWWERYVKKFKGAIISWWRRQDVRWRLAVPLLKLLWSPAFKSATLAVEDVAHDPRTRNFDAWAEVGRRAVSNVSVGENTFRHLAAVHQLSVLQPTLTPQERAVLVELAWLGIKTERS